jgi:hypothetical protein
LGRSLQRRGCREDKIRSSGDGEQGFRVGKEPTTVFELDGDVDD